MKEEVLKKLNIEINNECWKKLKILSIQKEISLNQCVKELLEKIMSKKSISEIEVS